MSSGRLPLGHFTADAAAHLAQNMMFQHKMGPQIAFVQRKLVFFNHSSIVLAIAVSPERQRLRFELTGEPRFLNVCCFAPENLTFHTPREYQQKRKCSWPLEKA